MDSFVEMAKSGVKESANRSHCSVGENQTRNATRTDCVPACDCLDWNIVSGESILETLSITLLTFRSSIHQEVVVHMSSSVTLLLLQTLYLRIVLYLLGRHWTN